MKNPVAVGLVVLWACLGGSHSMHAQNPIVQTLYTADPAPLVHDGTLYVYASHDEHTDSNFFTMHDWHLFSTKDLVNWTAHGVVASLGDLKWMDRDNGAWAPHCIERNGKFYLYVPIHGEGIGVLVADSPFGPFKDPLGRRFIQSANIWDDIDPTVLIDDDGQAYLYWGNPKLMYVRLNDDMISYDTSVGDQGIVYVGMTSEAFGERAEKSEKYTTNYEEGPWLWKGNGQYYLFFAAGGIPEVIAYSTGPTATGPWSYGGVVMDRHPGLSFTNHSGVVDFEGRTLFFYHNETLPGGGGFNRSVCVEELSFNPDGSVVPLIPTADGIREAIGSMSPYSRVEAETMAWSEGVKLAPDGRPGVYVTDLDDGDYIKLRNVAFGQGARRFEVHASATEGTVGSIEIRVDGKDGELLGVCEIKSTGTAGEWGLHSCPVRGVEGIHDLYLIFKGENSALSAIDWWRFDSEG